MGCSLAVSRSLTVQPIETGHMDTSKTPRVSDQSSQGNGASGPRGFPNVSRRNITLHRGEQEFTLQGDPKTDNAIEHSGNRGLRRKSLIAQSPRDPERLQTVRCHPAANHSSSVKAFRIMKQSDDDSVKKAGTMGKHDYNQPISQDGVYKVNNLITTTQTKKSSDFISKLKTINDNPAMMDEPGKKPIVTPSGRQFKVRNSLVELNSRTPNYNADNLDYSGWLSRMDGAGKGLMHQRKSTFDTSSFFDQSSAHNPLNKSKNSQHHKSFSNVLNHSSLLNGPREVTMEGSTNRIYSNYPSPSPNLLQELEAFVRKSSMVSSTKPGQESTTGKTLAAVFKEERQAIKRLQHQRQRSISPVLIESGFQEGLTLENGPGVISTISASIPSTVVISCKKIKHRFV